MPQDSTGSLFIRLGPSRRLTAVLGAVYVGAISCGFAIDLPVAIRGVVAVCVLFAGVRCIALHGSRRSARAIVLLVWDRRGRWRLLQRDGRVIDVRLESGGYTHPQLVVLVFRTPPGRRLRVLMVPDMVDADQLRCLRVRLRCEPGGEP
jgi:Membrane-bound toxin component of toxin-antitoxin system